MRFTRTITLLVAAFTAALLGLTLAPADATATATAERALPVRPITIKVEQIAASSSGVKVAIKGKAKAWKRKPVILQKFKGGAWHAIDRTRTNRRGHYRFTKWLGVGTHKFRVKVKRAGGYRTSYSAVAGGTVS